MFAAGLAAVARDNDVVRDNGLLQWNEVAIRRKWRSHVAVVKQANRLMLHNWERERKRSSNLVILHFFLNKKKKQIIGSTGYGDNVTHKVN